MFYPFGRFLCGATQVVTFELNIGLYFLTMILLDLRVYWDNTGGHAFVNETIPVINMEDMTFLSDFLRHEIINTCPNLQYADSDIKSMKSSSGTNKIRLLSFPVSVFYQSIINESKKELIVVLDRAAEVARSKEPPTDANQLLMMASVPKFSRFTSTWTLDDVNKFLSEYEKAPSKSGYLSLLTEEAKPKINEQMQTFAVAFLNDHGLRYKAGTGGEEKALQALKLLVQLMTFVQTYRQTLRRDHIQKYDSSDLLKSVERTVSSKVNPGKEPSLAKGKLQKAIDLANKCMHSWPSSYSRKERNIEIGKPIFIEIHKIREVLSDHFKTLTEQDRRNLEHRFNTISSGPTRFNTKTNIIPAKR